MAFVKVRETYDLHTVRNKMTVIAIHTPKSRIIKDSYAGLLMQCKAYRPYSCDVTIACASTMPLDPQGVGTAEGDVAPEDVFNPILYKPISNFGMSLLESRIAALGTEGEDTGNNVTGDTARAIVDNFTAFDDDFNIYYGLLSNTHEWKHANPQSGLTMRGLKPVVYEALYTVGDNTSALGDTFATKDPSIPDSSYTVNVPHFRGNSKPMPMINCTSVTSGQASSGFVNAIANSQQDVPAPQIICGCIIVPPSRLHELFYRMVVEWTLEFSMIRPMQDIARFTGVQAVGERTHYQNYDFSTTSKLIRGTEETILDSSDMSMVSANVDNVTKVM